MDKTYKESEHFPKEYKTQPDLMQTHRVSEGEHSIGDELKFPNIIVNPMRFQ